MRGVRVCENASCAGRLSWATASLFPYVFLRAEICVCFGDVCRKSIYDINGVINAGKCMGRADGIWGGMGLVRIM